MSSSYVLALRLLFRCFLFFRYHAFMQHQHYHQHHHHHLVMLFGCSCFLLLTVLFPFAIVALFHSKQKARFLQCSFILLHLVVRTASCCFHCIHSCSGEDWWVAPSNVTFPNGGSCVRHLRHCRLCLGRCSRPVLAKRAPNPWSILVLHGAARFDVSDDANIFLFLVSGQTLHARVGNRFSPSGGHFSPASYSCRAATVREIERRRLRREGYFLIQWRHCH